MDKTTKTTAPLRLIGRVALPDSREAVLTGDELWGLWNASLELVDDGQSPMIGVCAVTNDGSPSFLPETGTGSA
jgi:hypothetical protein